MDAGQSQNEQGLLVSSSRVGGAAPGGEQRAAAGEAMPLGMVFPDITFLRPTIPADQLTADDLIKPPRPAAETNLKLRRCRLLASLGPACSTAEDVRRMLEEGADGFRINLAKASDEENLRLAKLVREASEAMGRHVPIIASIQGPKFRIAAFNNPDGAIKLSHGQEILLTYSPNEVNNERTLQIPHAEIFNVVEVGDDIVFKNGPATLKVVDLDEDRTVITARVQTRGSCRIVSRSSLRIPSKLTSIAPLSQLDYHHLEWLAEHDVADWILFPHVNTDHDILYIRHYMKFLSARKMTFHPMVMVKVETELAIQNLKDIIENVDGVLVARGALGDEVDFSCLPSLQKTISGVARDAGKVCVVSTHILESLKDERMPTRAEISDVTNCVLDGVDGLLLASETSVGVDPINAVRFLNETITAVESDPLDNTYRLGVLYSGIGRKKAEETEDKHREADAIALSAISLASLMDAKAISVFSIHGGSVIRISRQRPAQPVLVLTAAGSSARWMGLLWGVTCRVVSRFSEIGAAQRLCNEAVIASGLAAPGDDVVIALGTWLRSSEKAVGVVRQGSNHLIIHTVG